MTCFKILTEWPWSSEICKAQLMWSKAYFKQVFTFLATSGLRLDHVFTMFCLALYPEQLELYSFHGWVIWDYVWTSCTSRPARVLNFSKLSWERPRHMCMKCPLLETMLGQCFDHVKSMFGISLAQYRLELWTFFKTESIWPKKHVLGVSMFWDPIHAMYWLC